ncbi:MAG: AAA family ATPase [Stenomitos frigidus ULC029]
MAGRSLRASTAGIQRARQALERRSLIQRSLEEEGIASWSTINKFFNGKPVARNIFLEICHRLDLDWEEIVGVPARSDAMGQVQSPPPDRSEPLPTPLLEAMQQASADAREALTPRILERIPRAVVQEKYLPAIARGVSGGHQRVIAIVGPAGYGKSTLLGNLYDELVQAYTPWIGLVLCSTLSLSTGFVSFTSYGHVAATFATAASTASYNPVLPSDYQASLLDVGFGKSLCGLSQPLTTIAQQLTAAYGRGVLLIDTLDLVLQRDVVPAFSQMLRHLLDAGVTVVFICRDHEYNDYLEPTRERLPGLSQAIDRLTVPNFTTAEIRAAAIAFFHTLEPEMTERGQTFADDILQLSADHRPLQEIIQNPLLLALLCELFAREGNVPPDLTVSKLYQRYWQEKIASSRLDHPDDAMLAMAKEQLCLTIARVLFEYSRERLCESLYRDELGLTFTGTTAQALSDLQSEGVLEQLPSRKLHFFHQTLLEYAIAYWLTRHTAQSSREQLFATLNQPDTALSKTYWLPVLRQLLTLVDQTDEFAQLVSQLDCHNLGLFGVVALAAASRDRPEALRSLLPTALTLGEPYQRRLRQALRIASRPLVESTWDILLTLLEHSEHATAGNTAQLAGELLARWWQTLQQRLPETLAAIARRSNTLASEEYRTQGDRALLLGWLLQPVLPLLAQVPEPSILAALQSQIHQLGYRTSAAVIQLHTHPSVPSVMQHALLQALIAVAVPNHEAVERALCHFVATLLPPSLVSSAFPLGNTWESVLYGQLPAGWDVIQSKAIGRWAAKDGVIFAALLHDLLQGEPMHLRRYLIALTESVDAGAAPRLLQCLLSSNPDALTEEHCQRLSPLLIRSAQTLTPTAQEQLAVWLQPQAHKHIQSVLPLLNALADASSTAQQLLVQAVETLPAAQQKQIRHQLLRFQPIDQQPPLATLDHRSQKGLVAVYRQQAATEPLALERLLLSAQGQLREIALLASLDLDQMAGTHLEPAQLLPLLQSHFPGVQANALLALTRLSHQKRLLTPEAFTHLCQLLATTANQAVARQFCALVNIWVRQQQQLPAGVLDVLAAIPTNLAKRQLFEGGTARALLDALKAIAQTERTNRAANDLGQLVHTLLTAISMIQVRNSEAEMIDLLSAMHRLDPQFLSTVLQADCPLMAERGWERNIAAVMKTIRRVEGPHSALLDQSLAATWCTPAIRGVVLEARSG